MDVGYLRDHAETRGFSLGRPVQAQPTPDGKAVLFLRAQARVPKMRLYEFDVATGRSRELVTPEQVLKGAEERLSPEEKAQRERMRVSVGGFTRFQVSDDGSCVLLSLSEKLYLVERSSGEVRKLETGAGPLLDPRFSPNGRLVSYVRDHDVYVVGLKTQQERRVTLGGSRQRTHGLAEFVAQEEMGRHSGYWWSPDSQYIVYEEADASGVEVWHVADPIRPDQSAHPTFYPRPGKDNVAVRLGIVAATGGDTLWIDWDRKKYPYLGRVHWDKHGPLTIVVETREQQELALLQVNPKTGKTSPLVIERDPAWVKLPRNVPKWLADGGSFLWINERDGGPQLELRDRAGALLRVLVPFAQGFQGLVDLDAQSGQFVYQASTDPTQTHLFRMSVKEGGEAIALATQPGLNSAVFVRNHSVYVLTTTSFSAMPKTSVHRMDGTLVGELPSNAEQPSFTPQVELIRVGDGAGYYATLVRPRNFDKHQRYPVILHVYGGPGSQMVLASMGSRLLDQWIADQGFIVVSLDGRGTPGRGRDWERAVYKHFGSVPLFEQMAGLKAVGRRFPELDLDRVGIYGWSFGGYLSALAVLRQPDVFKAAVAGAPVVDWLDYDTHYTERYLGVPDASADAYKEGSLLTYAADLQRPLLLVHGTADDNVYFRHSLKLADALFRAGKDFEILPLPGLTHMVPDPVVMQRLYARITQHFHKHLGKPTIASDRR